MTNETENLILEHLKRFQAQMTRFEDSLNTVRTDMRGLKQHMAAFMSSESSQDAEIAGIKIQLERIERRLELRD
ncbi:MAG: hypothetical protein AAF701_03810 [Pseudomonadota bacterium]